MYLVLSQVEHQTIECHRKNIYIVYLFGLSVVSLSYYYKPGRPPLASPGLPYLPGSSPLADLPWHTSPHTSPQTSPNTPLANIPCLADLPSASHTSLAGLEKTKNDECFEFLSFFITFLSFFIIFWKCLFIFLCFLGKWKKIDFKKNDKNTIKTW